MSTGAGAGAIASLSSAKIAVVGVWFAVLALAERLRPAAPRPAGSDRPRLVRNLGMWGANTLINPLIIAPIGAAAASFDIWTRPDAAPLWLGLGIDLIVLDVWVYWWHRLNHEWPLLWRFHRVHHLDQFLDATSAVRFHPGEVLISAAARAPIIILADIQLASLVLFDTALLAATIFHHSNVRLPPRLEAALRLLVVTPSHHWVHHHVAARDTNSNYATLLSVWDRLFRSWSPTRRTREMAIGAGDLRDMPLPALAAAPFRLQQ